MKSSSSQLCWENRAGCSKREKKEIIWTVKTRCTGDIRKKKRVKSDTKMHQTIAAVCKIKYNKSKSTTKGECIMANSLVQFHTDDASKIKATNICERLGIDLPTYMRMCISRLIQENGIPFSMKLGKEPENRAMTAMKAASRIAEENGISDMTLDEINAEIAEARKQGGL